MYVINFVFSVYIFCFFLIICRIICVVDIRFVLLNEKIYYCSFKDDMIEGNLKEKKINIYIILFWVIVIKLRFFFIYYLKNIVFMLFIIVIGFVVDFLWFI